MNRAHPFLPVVLATGMLALAALVPRAGFSQAPSITQQPQSKSVVISSNASFSVTASGTTPLRYQWSRNGTNLSNSAHVSGATNSTLTVSNVVAGDAGNYRVVVTNRLGSVTSSVATLTVQYPPSISDIPDQRTFHSQSTRAVPFTVGDVETPAQNLALSASSSNTGLVPTNNIVFGGSGSNRTVTVTPASGGVGTATITVKVRDADGNTAGDSFVVTVADFTLVNSGLPGVAAGSAAWGDYDNDGTLDVLLNGLDTNGIPVTQVFRNTGSGIFTNCGANITGTVGGGACWGDYNNDGKLDFMVSGSTSNNHLQWMIYRNDGSNVFTQSALLYDIGFSGASYKFVSLGWADFDNDGDLDPLFAGWPAAALFRNDRNDTFVNTGLGIPTSSELAWADYDNDGDMDLVIPVSGGSSAVTDLYENDGHGGFTVNTTRLMAFYEGSVAWGDIDNDGDLDIAFTGFTTNVVPNTAIFRNNNNGASFSLIGALLADQAGSLAWGDFNNDGNLDLVVTRWSSTRIYWNDGTGLFYDSGILLPGVFDGTVACGDFDNDGDLDILICGHAGGAGGPPTTQIWRNDGAMPNPPPNPPGNLNAVIAGNSAIFSWSAVTDSNQNGGFSYNLRIGTTPGGAEVCGPMADPATGYRRLPALGNAGERLGWTITNLAAGTYYWSVQAIDHAYAGSAFAAEQTFTLSAPVITNQPQSQSVIVGSNAVFSVGATGTGVLSYQWGLNGVPLTDGTRITGATTSQLNLSAVQSSDAGNYTVVVTNALGSTTSTAAVLNVLTPPAITQQPQDYTALMGDSATFAVTATGNPPVSYRWIFNGVPLADNGRISGSTNATLTIANLQTNDTGSYQVVVSNVMGVVTSTPAVLTLAAPPVITQQPQSQAVVIGAAAGFSVTATGFDSLGYQWFHDGVAVDGAISNVFSIYPAQGFQAGQYWVTVSNPAGITTSSNAMLTVITQPTTLVNLDFGGGTQSLKTGPAAIGQNAADFWNYYTAGSLSVTNLVLADGSPTRVGVVVSNAPSSASNGSSDPMLNDMIYLGQFGGSFNVSVFGLPAGSYDFFLYTMWGSYYPLLGADFELIVNGVSQGHSDLLGYGPDVPPWQDGVHYTTFRNIQVSAPGQALVVVVRGNFNEWPNVAGLQIGQFITNNTPPVIWCPPAGQFVPVGTNLVLHVTGTGVPAPDCQWFFNGTSLADGGRVTGAASNTLTIANVAFSDAGDYLAVLSNAAGAATSAVASVVVGLPPEITLQPSNQIVVVGANVQLTVSANGTAPLNYQWFVNGLALADDSHRFGSTSNLLSITNAQTSDTGNYSVAVSNAFGIANSVTSVLSVVQLPSITKQPVGRSVPVGLPAVFSATASGTPPLGYQWQLNGANLPGATSNSYTNSAVTTNDVGVYQLVVTNAGGTVTSSVAMLTIGPVAAWGNNLFGQALPPPGLSNVIAVSAGYNFSLALLADGTVVSWGGTSATNVPPDLNHVVAISAGNSHALALRSDGMVFAWGSNTSGQTNVPVTLSNVVAVSGGASHSAALRSDGTVVTWGGDTSKVGATNIPPDLTKVIGIDAGAQTLALRDDGSVVSWGVFGGVQVSGGSFLPVPGSLTNAVAVSAGQMHNLALTGAGTVVAWGGIGPATNVPPGLNDVTAVEAAGGIDQTTGASFALRSNGTVVAWGTSNGGMTNVPAGLSNVVAIAGSINHCLALENDGRPIILRPPVGGTAFTGRNFTLKSKATGAAPLGYQWQCNGTNLPAATNDTLVIMAIETTNAGNYRLIVSNALGVATSTPAPVVVMDSIPFFLWQPPATNRAWIGSRFTLASSVSGSGPLLLQWKFNGQNLPGATNDSLIFNQVRLTNMGTYTLVVSNSFGAISNSATLVPVSVVAWGGSRTVVGQTNVPSDLTNAIAVAANYDESLALRADGTVAAWGYNGSGQTNVPVNLSNVVEIAAGNYFNLALRGDGTVAAWGGNMSAAFTNALAGLTNVVALEADTSGATFLRPDGTALHYITSGSSNSFSLTNVVALAPFDDGFGALRADGTVFTFGGGGAPPPASNVIAIAMQRYYGVLLKGDGTVSSWGNPLPPTNLTSIVGIGPNAAIRSDGTITGWGGDASVSNTPAIPGSVVAVDAGTYHGLALLVARDFPPVLLPGALDTSALVVSSHNSPQWFGQTSVTHDGVDAAQSAEIGNNTASSMRMWIAGPLNISFWWKVSSQTNRHFLSFSIGGVAQTNISGEMDWQQCTIGVPAGNQILQWTYSKDGSDSAGQDAGWVDQLGITPIAPSIVTQPQSQTVLGGSNVTFAVSATGTPPLNYGWRKGGANLTTTTPSLMLPNVTRTNSGTYSVIVTNIAGSVTSSNAVLAVHVPQLLFSPLFQPDGTVLLNSHDADGGALSSNDLANLQAQASTNLMDWAPLPDALTVTNGMLRIYDPGSTNFPTRFYRILENW